MSVAELVPYKDPCAKVRKLRASNGGIEAWDDWCYVHHHWLNGAPAMDITEKMIRDVERYNAARASKADTGAEHDR